MAQINAVSAFMTECTASKAESFYLCGEHYEAYEDGGRWYIKDKYGVPHVAYPEGDGVGLYIPGEVQFANGVKPIKITFERV